MLTHLDCSSFTNSWTLSHADCSLLLSGVDSPLASPFANCLPLGSFFQLLLAFPYPLPVTLRSRAQAFVWLRAKTDKGIVCLADHLHSVTPVPHLKKQFILQQIINKCFINGKKIKQYFRSIFLGYLQDI